MGEGACTPGLRAGCRYREGVLLGHVGQGGLVARDPRYLVGVEEKVEGEIGGKGRERGFRST